MSPERIAGIDHVSVPMRDTEAIVAFYRSLGFSVTEHGPAVSVRAGQQMINFHRPELWEARGFSLRAPGAVPPCGDLCFVWEGTGARLREKLAGAGASIEEGPVAREGGRGETATSVYVRDPDGNLLEFMIYDG
jgi:catechol 2,3-dioxygenase-like lactoylglutathione lyase family enzyme